MTLKKEFHILQSDLQQIIFKSLVLKKEFYIQLKTIYETSFIDSLKLAIKKLIHYCSVKWYQSHVLYFLKNGIVLKN